MRYIFAMSGIGITSVNVPTAASLSQQVSARPNRVAGDATPLVAGLSKNAREVKQQEKPDMLANLKAIEAQIAARAEASANINTLDISYNKKEALLSVKVQEQQTDELIRELKFKEYKAMAYAPYGFKGAHVDLAA